MVTCLLFVFISDCLSWYLAVVRLLVVLDGCVLVVNFVDWYLTWLLC